jgi:hypothetical protein
MMKKLTNRLMVRTAAQITSWEIYKREKILAGSSWAHRENEARKHLDKQRQIYLQSEETVRNSPLIVEVGGTGSKESKLKKWGVPEENVIFLMGQGWWDNITRRYIRSLQPQEREVIEILTKLQKGDVIVAHSQGNTSVENVLKYLCKQSLTDVRIVNLASPIRVSGTHNFAKYFDPVHQGQTFGQLRETLSTSTGRTLLAGGNHTMLSYLNDPSVESAILSGTGISLVKAKPIALFSIVKAVS